MELDIRVLHGILLSVNYLIFSVRLFYWKDTPWLSVFDSPGRDLSSFRCSCLFLSISSLSFYSGWIA